MYVSSVRLSANKFSRGTSQSNNTPLHYLKADASSFVFGANKLSYLERVGEDFEAGFNFFNVSEPLSKYNDATGCVASGLGVVVDVFVTAPLVGVGSLIKNLFD